MFSHALCVSRSNWLPGNFLASLITRVRANLKISMLHPDSLPDPRSGGATRTSCATRSTAFWRVAALPRPLAPPFLDKLFPHRDIAILADTPPTAWTAGPGCRSSRRWSCSTSSINPPANMRRNRDSIRWCRTLRRIGWITKKCSLKEVDPSDATFLSLCRLVIVLPVSKKTSSARCSRWGSLT